MVNVLFVHVYRPFHNPQRKEVKAKINNEIPDSIEMINMEI